MFIQSHEERSFLGWMRETGNIFTGDEYNFRFGVWLSNKRYVQEHNAANFGFTLAMNRLAHLTPTEYRSLLGYRSSKVERKVTKSNAVAADQIDWRKKCVVNEVQNQGACGSCWAFSAIQAQESQYAIVFTQLWKLSEQNLVDCVKKCHGCNGGEMYMSYDYVIQNQKGKFMLETDYPYTARDGVCKFDASKAVSQISRYEWADLGNEDDLARKISSIGPASVGIDASLASFHLYSGGIYEDSACSMWSLDHGVGVVGYGSESGKNYWIVRNSWGSAWGEKGYIRIAKDKENMCGIATEAIFPIDQ
ncbi:Clan CA, family C1, cathepsin L-like cysteine peptidase [Trichomonas vaginalis G3]|uniref:Clan CA, family C1, cathepsin L-like cysteine peptidase n=1 Tax=Trichomonas vaginalis (strain ATCC PRA-98 / G3) TaxID=412133 RepID=A2E1V4_TRIV3|nr:cysteine-type peptidase protein [Trichomonas vaginalis G3]EAY13303.1 Clan CA, family C1, cathepsin L-like cysteine peptidase [Trichomonas vaginalis G3]KAI5540430.1 cysteine-type peptidase protein [Trichomonas vaginalis G3]|eukprot:XP_001325526.1 Clan CA, family C1, cathepsin L-like cysteine peptidase [Trichomonas vaginalis G3]